jgi:opacity protein-like surface antigen
MKSISLLALPSAAFCLAASLPVAADENLLGYVSGAETLPQGASEAYVWLTRRWDKGQGKYTAYDSELEFEYGVTSRFTASVALLGQSIDTDGLVIDAYLPGAESYGLKPSGIELKGKYNFLSAAMDPVGLSAMFELHQSWLDPHSGKDKDTTSFDVSLQLQKFFLDDQLVAVANAGFEGTYAKRAPLDAATQASADLAMQALTLDPGATFEWPTKPEMELEFTLGGGLSYRFAPNWNIGVETQYQTEFETEVGQERWSWFAGPSIHYGGKQWWATATWFNQLAGGREQYINQTDDDLHLIEKTKNELRLKLGYNF